MTEPTKPRVEDSHYIPHFIAKNWEWKPGFLRVCNLATNRIERGSAKSTPVSPVPYPPEIEDALGARIESNVGELVARVKKTGGNTMPINAREDRAVVLALLFQAPRATFLTDDLTRDALAAVLEQDDAVLDAIVARARSRFGSVFGVHIPRGNMALTTAGMAALVCVIPAGFLLPLTPNFAAILLHPKTDEQLLHSALQPPSAFRISVGLTGDRVILPPTPTIDEERAIREVRSARLSNLHAGSRLEPWERAPHFRPLERK